MTNFQLLYAVRSLITGSYQDAPDVQLYRASIVEQKLERKLNEYLDTTSDAYVK